MDKISNLPDVLIDGILEKLPLLDQVRTSILSSSWRHRWAKIRSLVIDETFYKFFSTSKPMLKKRRSNTEFLANEEYLNVINSLLVQHIGHLVEFSLFIPDNDLELMPGYHLPVQYVLRNGTTSLSLTNYNDDCFVLPLFSAMGLEHLRLESCELRLPPAFHGFPNLVSFFQNCDPFRGDTISKFFSSCPILEVVELYGLDYSDRDLNIPSPKLRSLSLSGEFKSISLSSAQTMEILKLFYMGSTISSVDLTVLHSMTNLKRLALGYDTCKILAQCTDFPRFDQMNRLSLYDMFLDDIDSLKCMLSLCTSSPNLRQLDIMRPCCCTYDDMPEWRSVLKKYRNHDFGNLRTVNINEASGSKTEMNYIELLLSRSPLLELMSIKVDLFLGTSKKLTIVEDVTGFCRLSPNAKIKFLKQMEDDTPFYLDYLR